MNKNKTNLSVVNNAGIRVKPSIIVGEQGSYSSGDILDANAVQKIMDDANYVASTTVKTIVVLTQDEYDTLVSNNQIDANTEYNIIESTPAL